MYALQLSAFGEPSDVVHLVNVPEPQAPVGNEVLIGVEFAPINPAHLLTIRGWYGMLPSLPAGIGTEGVGTILAVGEQVRDLHVGDRVLLPYPSPSWREQIVVPSTGLFPLPQHADPQQLAMLSVNPTTAAFLLSDYVTLSPGDWIVQNAGNSGVGRAVIAFAKDRGLRTISLVRRHEFVDELLAAGGDVVLVDGAGIAPQIADATGHAKITLGLDGVGGASTSSVSGSLAPGGTLVIYSAMSGQPGRLNPADIIFRNVAVRGFWLDNPEVRTSCRFQEALHTGARLIAEGTLRTPVAATYPLTAAKEALAHAQNGGKVLFKLS